MTIPTDTLYSQQWHFAKITNVASFSLMERLWTEFNGSGVHVGVYDSGIEYNHSDLNDNYDSSLHVAVGGNTLDGATVGNNGQGTSVAGIIGAEFNGEGTVGIAWGSKLTSVNIFDPTSPAFINAAIPTGFFEAVHQMSDFDVTNNSWGSSPAFAAFQNLNEAGSFESQVNNEYQFSVANGRNGLGTIIVQEVGDDNRDGNGDGLNASRYTITVGALLENGYAASYSNYGACLLISSAGGDRIVNAAGGNFDTTNGTRLITTTDQVGANGFNDITPNVNTANPPNYSLTSADFTDGMNGTSAATPMVSGIVALMLDANPNLGWRDVQNILANTAFQTGSGVGNAPGLNENTGWLLNQADGWNGGGMHFSNDYGYGNADAFGAVRLAEALGVMGAAPHTSANEQSTTTGTVVSGAVINPLSNNSYNFVVSGNLSVEHVDITIDLTHSSFTDLRISLVSADGTEVQLYDGLTGNAATADGGLTWTFGIEALRGELSVGTWTLKVNDVAGNGSGTLNDVKIDLFGSTSSGNDIYRFTDEFDFFASFDPSRATLIDADGGTDWFDGSALLASANVDLNDGATSAVDGQLLTIAAGTFIENAILSDGNDVILGNELRNRLYGMRGADTVNGGDDNDTVSGGVDNDEVQGNAGNDSVNGNAGQDTVGGGQGNDTVTGEAGNDVLAGGEGNDSLQGNDGNDSENGGAGQDTMGGGMDNDTLFGGADNDTIQGGKGNDSVYGSSTIGDATVEADTLSGGEGNDFVQGNGGNDLVNGDAGQDTVGGGADNDVVNGGADDDQIKGGAGGDLVRGGTGHDILAGGADNDTFIFLDGDGADTVSDFADNGVEKIDLSGLVVGAQHFGQLVVTDTAGPGITVNYGTGNVLFSNINTTGQIDAGDFIF